MGNSIKMVGVRVLGVTGPKKVAKASPSTGKSARFYPADDIPRPKHSRAKKHNAPKIRGSFTPGTVCILLSGRFRGKRVVCLKALESGLLLISGPYKINGVPLRRVNQAYVIGTSTSVDVSKVDVSKVDDSFFGKSGKSSARKSGEEFFKEGEKKHEVSDAKKEAQKTVDTPLLKVIGDDMKSYLAARFTLTKNDKPHAMKF